MTSFLQFVRSKRIASVAFSVIVPVLFLIIGIAAGIGVWRARAYLDAHSLWYRIPTPPAEPIGLIGARPGCVYLNAEDGQAYSYCETREGYEGIWQALDEPPRIVAERCSAGIFSEPPRRTTETVEFCIEHEFLDATSFALLEDGRIMLYRVVTDSAMGYIGRAIGAIVLGAVAGLIVGIGVVVIALPE